MTEVSGEELMHLFRYCFNLMRRRYHQTVHGKVGTRQGQGKILSVLRREDGIGQKELAERLQIRPASLSELLDKMQKSGWIQRRVNEKDRRKINIFLTEDGKGISQQMIEARRDMASTVFWRIERGGTRAVGDAFIEVNLGTGKKPGRRVFRLKFVILSVRR